CFRRSSWCLGLEPIITPSKFRTASFPSATSSKGLLREALTGEYRSSYATQRVPKGLSGFDGRLAGLVQFAQGAVRSAFGDIAQRRVVEEHRFIFVGLITSSKQI